LALAVAGCDGVRIGAGGPAAGTDEQKALDTLASRSLALPDCRGAADLADLGSVFVFSLDTPAEVSGSVPGTQTERVVRQGVAALCLDGQGAVAQLLTCALVRTPVEDASGDCAALLPSVKLLAGLPAAMMTGGLDPAEPESTLVLSGFDERWGLAGDATTLPDELPEDPTMAAGVVDADEDGDPGVTLKGDGEVPTSAWAVRRTQANVVLRDAGRGRIEGVSIAETAERVLGGPAGRAVSGRTYTSARGEVTFVRVDGLAGTPRADADRNGVVTCAEGARYFGRLPGLPTTRCD
jgi:hypothetical protein